MRFTAIVVASLIALTVPSKAEWVRKGPGPSLEQTLAYCENAAMGLPTPMMQQPGLYVDQYGRIVQVPNNLGTGLGNLGAGIGHALRKQRFKRNCMIANGWTEKKSGKKSKTRADGSKPF